MHKKHFQNLFLRPTNLPPAPPRWHRYPLSRRFHNAPKSRPPTENFSSTAHSADSAPPPSVDPADLGHKSQLDESRAVLLFFATVNRQSQPSPPRIPLPRCRADSSPPASALQSLRRHPQ